MAFICRGQEHLITFAASRQAMRDPFAAPMVGPLCHSGKSCPEAGQALDSSQDITLLLYFRVRCCRGVTFAAIRLRGPGFKPRPGQKFETSCNGYQGGLVTTPSYI